MYYKLVFGSENRKTGPIPVSMSGNHTCPSSCPLKAKGCYALYGYIGAAWNKLSRGERGGDFATLLSDVRRISLGSLWRHNAAGDLVPSAPDLIDQEALRALTEANRKRRGFTYTHYDPKVAHNAAAIKEANDNGFTINLSADSLEEADAFADLGIAPVVTTLPTASPKSLRTPAGRRVVTCPATYREDVTCASCGICQNASPTRAIIGFPAHGAAKRAVEEVFINRGNNS